MPIHVTCSCGRAINAPLRLGGRVVKCPKCKKPLQVPKLDLGDSSEEASPPVAQTAVRQPAPPAMAPPPAQLPPVEDFEGVLPESEEIPDLSSQVAEAASPAAGQATPDEETHGVAPPSQWVILDVLTDGCALLKRDFVTVIFAWWMFAASFIFYCLALLGLPVWVGYMRFLKRTIEGAPTGFKEFIVPDMVRVIYRDGFWSGLWTSIKMMFQFCMFFAIELVALAAMVAVVSIPFVTLGLYLGDATGRYWVPFVCCAPVAILAFCVWILWLADYLTCTYLFGARTPERYTFDVFCDYFWKSWEKIRENKSAYLQLLLSEILVGLLAAVLTAFLLWQAKQAGAAKYLLFGGAALLWVFLLPLMLYFEAFFLKRVAEEPEAKDDAAQTPPAP